MKKQTGDKKITLHIGSETLRKLQTKELREVVGGRPPLTRASNADVCCA